MPIAKFISRAASKRAAQGLKGPAKSATRLDESGKKVHMSKDTRSGVLREVASGKGKQQQSSPTAQRIRKAESKQATDLQQPAAGSVGKNVEQADAGLPAFKVASKKASDFDKALSKKEKQLENYKSKRDSLTGKAKIKFIAENKTRIDSLKDSIKDMKSRGGPGGKSKLRKFQRDRIGKKEGGKIVKASKGSQGKLIGKQKKLDINKDGKITGSDFEMFKSNRKKYGGKITYKMTGGQVVDAGYD